MARQGKSTNDEVSFADVMLEKRCRKAQNVFLNQVDRLIDWRPIRTLINKKYTKRQNAAGAPAYDVILLFKMLLLQTWYGLSDCALEERVNDSVTFSRFLGLSMEAVSPDHSTISRFRTALTEFGLMDKLLKAFNKQLSAHHISIKEGVLQQRQSMTINRNDKSTSISTQMDSLIPASKISNLTQGMFVGAVSDNFDERIEQKIFHAEIVVDSAKVSAETKTYEPIPTIADFTNEDGSDNLKETIEANYKRVKQEILLLVESEKERIKADPALAHLNKE